MDLKKFALLIAAQNQPLQGVCGRLIRGKRPEDFKTLSDDPDRKIVMLIDPQGLQKLLGKSGYDMLIEVGYEPSYLKHKIEQGYQFKLVLFPEGSAAKIATWDNVLDMVSLMYPKIAAMIEQNRARLKAAAFSELEQEAGYKFLDVEKKGKDNPLFLTYERLQRSDGRAAQVRAFLYFTVHLRELFAGDGWTRTESNEKGVQEYIIPNKPLDELGDYELVDIKVELPKKVAIAIGRHMNLPRLPSFWDPKNVYDPFYQPNFQRAREEGRKLAFEPVAKQIERGDIHLALLIDIETDFMDYFRYVKLPFLYGRLPVIGALDDTVRLCARIIRGVYEKHYTHFILTIDKHPPHVIHGDSWWKDEHGNPPDVTLPVQMELIDEAKAIFLGHFANGETKYFRPQTMKQWTVEYAKHLAKTGQGNVWVFTSHCRAGTDGTAIVPALAEIIEWASAARMIQPIYLDKGMIAQVDWFGPFRPCMDVPNHPQGGIQTVYLDYIQGMMIKGQLRKTKSVDVAGQAKDFCVEAGTNQIMEYFGSRPDVLNRINFLNDCTSAIFPDSPKVKQFEERMKARGINLINHDNPF